MKVTVKQVGKEVKRNYPYIGEHSTGLIVLFSNPNAGTVLRDSIANKHPVGTFREIWTEEDYDLFEGEVILSND